MRAHGATLGDGDWVRAAVQTKGRGRQGRAWRGGAGNLAMSGLVRLRPGEGPPPELAFVLALAVHDAIAALMAAQHGDVERLAIKWPNDLLLDRGKIAGILIEGIGGREKDGADGFVVGVGVNIAAAPAVAGRAIASLGAAGIVIEASPLAEAIAAAVSARRDQWQSEGFAAIRRAWLARAHPVGTKLVARAAGEEIAGAFLGLDRDGALLLQDKAGSTRRIHAGDVFALHQEGPCC